MLIYIDNLRYMIITGSKPFLWFSLNAKSKMSYFEQTEKNMRDTNGKKIIIILITTNKCRLPLSYVQRKISLMFSSRKLIVLFHTGLSHHIHQYINVIPQLYVHFIFLQKILFHFARCLILSSVIKVQVLSCSSNFSFIIFAHIAIIYMNGDGYIWIMCLFGVSIHFLNEMQ